jgi:hypothetical protein
VVLVLIALSLILEALVGLTPGAGIVTVVVRVGTLALVLRTTRSPVRSRRTDLLVLLPALAIGAPAATQVSGEAGLLVTSVVITMIAAVEIGAIVRRLVRHQEVGPRTAAGALAVYLLIGSAFAGIYGILAAGPAPALFAATPEGQPPNGTSLDRLYFSFVCLTTVGFGDFTPGTNLARISAVLEALLGQLYLVTVVALVIGGLGSSRSSGKPSSAARELDDPGL